MNNILSILTDLRVVSHQPNRIILNVKTYTKAGEPYKDMHYAFIDDMYKAVVKALAETPDEIIIDGDEKEEILRVAETIDDKYTNDIYTLFVFTKFMKTVHFGIVSFTTKSITFDSFRMAGTLTGFDSSVKSFLNHVGIMAEKKYNITTLYNSLAKYIKTGKCPVMIPNKTNK